jgi:hypothetical protein
MFFNDSYRDSMTEKTSSGSKITGFFGFFDILGYAKMIELNDLDTIIQIYDSIFPHLDKSAMAFAGLNNPQNFEQYFVIKSLAFSDTFILYQDVTEIPDSIRLAVANNFILTSSYLLRLAFDRGIPLRGAISFGNYFIRESPICFLGSPIVEAFVAEKKQEWSGAILCESAQKIIQNRSENIDHNQLHEILRKSSESCSKCSTCSFPKRFDQNNLSLIEYDVPIKNDNDVATARSRALCWDDSVIEAYIKLGLGCYGDPPKNDREIYDTVRKKFSSHKKSIESRDVQRKMENTANFLNHIYNTNSNYKPK